MYVRLALPEATHVTLEVFNSVGQKVMDLINGQQSAGYHTVTFDASGLSSGVYLYKLTTPSFTETKKMLLIK
jgi:flagellar hook assembly protein FlgD